MRNTVAKILRKRTWRLRNKYFTRQQLYKVLKKEYTQATTKERTQLLALYRKEEILNRAYRKGTLV